MTKEKEFKEGNPDDNARVVEVTEHLHKKAKQSTTEYINHYKPPENLKVSVRNSYYDGYVSGHKEKINESLNELKEKVENNVGSWDSDRRFNECKEQIIELIDEAINE